MALQSNTQIYIGGSAIKAYKRLMLHQEIDSHHILELVCRMDVLESITQDIASESKNYLGQVLTIQISSIGELSGYHQLEFKGIVTAVNSTKGFHRQNGDLVTIKAQSCSIIADDGPNYTSYNDIDLGSILENTFQGYDQSKLENIFAPRYADNIHYSVQHNESAYEYASRLAAQYSEWFYYDGKALVFGKPEDDEEVELTYGHDLQEFSVNLIPLSNNYRYFTNDYLTDSQHNKSSSQVSSGANGYNGFTSNKSDAIFSKETAVYLNSYNDPQLKQRLDRHVEQQKKSNEINQVVLSGVSDNPGVNIGKVIKIQGDGAEYGRFRITRVTHTNTENGKYQNRFEGVTADLDVYPNTNMMAFPKSDTQVAIVRENNDPDGLSRVRVEFPWQKQNGELTPWLRIVTPHAGGDKGFHFVPEIDEEVLIGFEGRNAERPFVMGTLYNGSANPSSWQTEANDIKAIRTRSGHTIEFNDTNGSEFISITDKNRNLIHIDTANNDITISAGENMVLNAKNMQINVEENLDITVGKNKTENISEDSFIIATNEEKQIGETIKVISSEYKQEAQEISTDASGEIKTNAGGKITIASAETVEYGE
ncbi:type VI secretion system Vgr family protein [Aquimarina sp. 2201CG5-10]|uniref:type VI secretion system Vgr family protein n=1 Tax=Aquimarina callyspongiae TaxID=3098150 RepID=UPI002AB5046A|nr:phage baseplate assembly protein V [Aquimarina sp. 2201CG5-10]MDY8138335.1 phage baseplate assembly protein V [Aquimarina sp. 2201CG5-10]